MKRFRFTASLMVVAVAFSAVLARGQVLDSVPGDALLVVKVTNLANVSAKVAKFANTLGLDQFEPKLADPLGAVQESSGVRAGLDPAGDLAIVMVDPAKNGLAEDDSVLVLIPITDYAAFLGNFKDAANAEAAGVSKVTMPDSPKPGYVADWGKYAALSPAEVLVGKKPTGVKVGGLSAKQLNEKDVVVYGNFKELKKLLTPELEKVRGQAIADIDKKMGAEAEDKARYAPLAKVVVNQLFSIASSFLRDVDGATFAVNLNDDGIAATLLADFEAGSYIGKQFSALKSTDDSLLTGLPAEKYLVLGGWSADPEIFGKLIDDILDPAVTELNALGEEGAPIVKFVEAFRKGIDVSEGQTIGLVAPTGQIGQAALIQAIILQHGEPKAINASMQEYVTSMEGMMSALGGGQPSLTATTFKPAAKTVDGVAFDEFKTAFNINPGTPEEQQALQFLNLLYGPNGATGYSAPVDDNTLLVVSGGDDAMLQSALAAAKAKDQSLAKGEGISLVARNLPLNRVGAFYIDLGEIGSTALNYAGQFGIPINVQLPPGLPPIGVTLATEGPAARVDCFVPTTLIQSLVAAGMQAAMQFQGGGGGGGGGGGMGPN